MRHDGAALMTTTPMTTLRPPCARAARITSRWPSARLAHNYHPLPVVLARGEGAWVWDVEGRRYLDCLAAYSAVNFGHSNPTILAAARSQLDRGHADQPGVPQRPARAVRGRAVGLVRQGHGAADEHRCRGGRDRHQAGPQVGLPGQGRARPTQANIIVAAGNFHGRTTTVISFSDDPQARADFGPFTPGFRQVPFGDAAALAAAIDAQHGRRPARTDPGRGRRRRATRRPTCRRCGAICDERNVLFIADEIQSGLARTGATFACDHVDVRPTSTCSVRPSVVASCRCPQFWPIASVMDVLRSRASTARRSAATRWRRPSVAAWSPCWPPASRSGARPTSARSCITSSPALIGHGVTAVRGLRPVGRRRHRSRARHRSSDQRSPSAERDSGQGHPRQHDPLRSADLHRSRGDHLGRRSTAPGAVYDHRGLTAPGLGWRRTHSGGSVPTTNRSAAADNESKWPRLVRGHRGGGWARDAARQFRLVEIIPTDRAPTAAVSTTER